MDLHHPAGRSNNPAAVLVPVNDHRAVLSPQQYEWPQQTWENPERSPILCVAANIRGYCETNDYLVAKLLLPLAEVLETLDATLKKTLGSKWWVGTEMERFAPRRKPKK
jgi:hypothetical protein